jgi:DNA-binding MurR/RpiR family transcriptional regulator
VNKIYMNSNDQIEQLLPRLRLIMNSLSKNERLVLQYCIDRGEKIRDDDISAIASWCSVSSALVVKVAKKCGYSGYRELRAALSAYAAHYKSDLHKELNPLDPPQMVIDKIFGTSISALQDTKLILDPEELKAVSECLIAADKIAFIGIGGSAALALDAYHKFLRIGVVTQWFNDSHLMVMSASLMTPKSVLIGFSHSGRTSAIIEAFKAAKKQKAKTVAITNTPESLLGQYSDYILCSVAQGSPINGENSAARIAQLNILDILFVLYAQHNYENSLSNLSRTIESVAQLRI